MDVYDQADPNQFGVECSSYCCSIEGEYWVGEDCCVFLSAVISDLVRLFGK